MLRLNTRAKLLIGGLVACGRTEVAIPEDVCAERIPMIASGVYGCVTRVEDVGTPSVSALAGFRVQAFVAMPPPTPEDGLKPLVETQSDEAGFYEVPLAPGAYWLCSVFRRCTAVQVPAGGPVRRNYEFGPGPGW